MHIARLARGREIAVQMPNQTRQGYTQPTEQARPVLGVQPPAPGTIPIRYTDTEYQETRRELVTLNPYYEEPNLEWQGALNERFDVSGLSEGGYVETNSMMLLGRVPHMKPQYP